jgi:putative hydrolases of HD superfamily
MVHDLAESIVGDYTPQCKISREEKFLLEEVFFLLLSRWRPLSSSPTFLQTAFKKIMEDLAPLETSQEMFSLWQEFENGNCLEADIARQLDKLEMIIQADEYERQQGVQLQDFFDSTATAFSHPEVHAFLLLL